MGAIRMTGNSWIDRLILPSGAGAPALASRTGLLVLVLATLAGCGTGDEGDVPALADGPPAAGEVPTEVQDLAQAEIPEGALLRAREAADALGASLQQRLFGALDEGGPMLAVEVCSVEAQEISESFAADDLSVRRVSLLTRNPVNDPDPWEFGKLEELEEAHEAGETLQEEVEVVQENGESVLRLVRPILVAQPCLTCHGETGSIQPDVLERIRVNYPEDRATGYSLGDFRGLVSVQVRLDP